MAASNLYSVNTIDANGTEAKFRVPVAGTIFSPSAAGPLAIKTALKNAINSAVVGGELSTAATVASYTPAATGYFTVQDRLVLTFPGEDGSTQNYRIPAPVDGIFEAGSDSIVDVGNALIVTYSGAMGANAKTEANITLEDISSGLRTGTKLEKGR